MDNMSDKKLKVFLCITKSDWGGAQKYVYDVATQTPEYIDMTVLLGGGGELKRRLNEAKVNVITLENSQRDINTKKEAGLFFELFKIFKKEKPDVIHLNSSKMGLMGALVGRLTRVKKIIFIAHGWAFNEERPWYQKIFFRILHILTILLSHQTIAVSEITKKQIGWPWNKKITIVRNGLREIDFIEKEPARKILTEKINRPILSDALWIGTISELHKTKGLKYAIEAVSKIKENIVFVIIGEGHARKDIEKLIEDFKVSDKVFLTGRIESASTYIKAFDIFTLTSITEALPYALLEAGAAGLAVVASNVGGVPEIIENDVTGLLCNPRNIQQIQDAIGLLIRDQEKAKRLGNNLKEKVKKDFRAEDMIKKTFELYKI